MNLTLMRMIDEEYMRHPFYGSRRMMRYLRRCGHTVNRKRVQRLMQAMGLEAIYPKPNTSRPDPGAQRYPYLLKHVTVDRANQVWCTDITYIRLTTGFVYLVAVMDWHSRYVISWELSNTLDGEFCRSALNRALLHGKPDIFNSDQGSQFTSNDFTNILKHHTVQISRDGRGRAMDNIFVERLWRSVKYENIYLNDYQTMRKAYEGIKHYFDFYNNERQHQSLGYKTPKEVYEDSRATMLAA